MKLSPRWVVLSLLLAVPGGRALAQDSDSISTDRPGLLFGSTTVGKGVFVTEWGIPAVTQINDSGFDVRLTSLVGLLRYGVTDNFELRLGSPIYNQIRVSFGGFSASERGFGDAEVGAKWHLFDNAGARPSFALIPSVIIPVGEKGFSSERPIYQLNAMAEWNSASGWTLGVLAGYLNGPEDDGRYGQETFGVSLGHGLSSPNWSAFGEAAYVATNQSGAGDPAFAGAGIKYTPTKNLQLDLAFDRGLNDDSPDWLYGFGVSFRWK